MNISSFDEMSRIGSLLRIILTVLSNPLIHHCWQPADTPLLTTRWYTTVGHHCLTTVPDSLRPLPPFTTLSENIDNFHDFDHFRPFSELSVYPDPYHGTPPGSAPSPCTHYPGTSPPRHHHRAGSQYLRATVSRSRREFTRLLLVSTYWPHRPFMLNMVS